MNDSTNVPAMNSAGFLATQETARALGFELMARIVLTPVGVILAKAQLDRGAFRKTADFAEVGTVGFTLRKVDLLPLPAGYAGEAFQFVPQPGDEQFERTFNALTDARAWLAKLASTPEVAQREPITAFEPGATTSLLFVPAQRPASEKRKSGVAPATTIHPLFNVTFPPLPTVQVNAPIHVHTTETTVDVHIPGQGATEDVIERDERNDIRRVVRRPLETPGMKAPT